MTKTIFLVIGNNNAGETHIVRVYSSPDTAVACATVLNELAEPGNIYHVSERSID